MDIAHNGIEGLQKLNKNEYDVAIIDIRMPKMDGITLAQKVREAGIDTSIIILTGHGDKDEAVSAINIGVDAWFDKAGIKMQELLQKVQDLANRRKTSYFNIAF